MIEKQNKCEVIKKPLKVKPVKPVSVTNKNLRQNFLELFYLNIYKH